MLAIAAYRDRTVLFAFQVVSRWRHAPFYLGNLGLPPKVLTAWVSQVKVYHGKCTKTPTWHLCDRCCIVHLQSDELKYPSAWSREKIEAEKATLNQYLLPWFPKHWFHCTLYHGITGSPDTSQLLLLKYQIQALTQEYSHILKTLPSLRACVSVVRFISWLWGI